MILYKISEQAKSLIAYSVGKYPTNKEQDYSFARKIACFLKKYFAPRETDDYFVSVGRRYALPYAMCYCPFGAQRRFVTIKINNFIIEHF